MCDRFPRKFDVQTSYKPSSNYLGLMFVVNIKFSRATYHTIVPSTEELYCLNRQRSPGLCYFFHYNRFCPLKQLNYPSSFCLCDGKFGCQSMTVSSKLTSSLILLFKVYLRRKNEYKKDTSLVAPQAIDGLTVDRNVFIQ